MTEVICLEGCERTGVTTHANLLAEHLQSLGKKVLLFEEGKYESLRSARRNLYRDHGRISFSALNQLAEERAKTQKNELFPNLKEQNPDYLVLDRCYLGDAVCFSEGGSLTETIIGQNSNAGVIPVNRGIILYCPPETLEARARVAGQMWRHGGETVGFQQGYARLARAYPTLNLKVIDSNTAISYVSANIKASLFKDDIPLARRARTERAIAMI